MATITAGNLAEMQKSLRGDTVAKTERQASGLSKSQLLAVVQAVEDFWTSNQATLKSDADAAAGVTLTNTFAKKIAKAWMTWKYKGE